jgi:uncharacterized protein (DUF362 family)
MLSSRLRVCIRRAPGGAQNELLEEVLEAAGFWTAIEAVRRARKSRRAGFAVVIKPDLDVYNLALPSGTDPGLVRHLAVLLRQRGYKSVTVIDARNSPDPWLLNREPLAVADLAGYDFSGDPYAIEGGDNGVAPAEIWSSGDFRINFAKNRTHESQSYALCVHNLLGVSPRVGPTFDLGERCLGVLQQFPAHFNLIDAFASCHGAAGERAPMVHKTCTLIASADALLADLVGASKMGLDPYISPLNAKCLGVLGLPSLYDIDGDLVTYPLWQNVHPLVASSARRRNRTPGLGDAVAAWFQTVDREHFPFREFYNDRINSFVAPLLARIGDDARAQWIVVILNHLIANIGNLIHAQHTLFAKGELERQVKALETDLERFTASDYTNLPAYLSSFEQLMRDAPQATDLIRLRRLDNAMLFFGSYEFPIEYEEFVERVSIARAIQYMNDYIGGSQFAVASDERGRVQMQAERNLYLQQPNWMVLFGGDLIDVEKIEFIERGPDKQSIFWRTVASPNGSAQSDDGRVTFARAPNGCARMEIFTRQKFTLPLFFEVVGIDNLPGVRDPIVTSAYKNFFDRTVANMHAEFEGRSYRIGHERRPADSLAGGGLGDVARYFATALAALSELLRHKSDLGSLGDWFAARSWSNAPVPVATSDSDGFRHFGPSPKGARYDRVGEDARAYFKQLEEAVLDAPEFFAGLATAVQSDLETFAEHSKGEAPI